MIERDLLSKAENPTLFIKLTSIIDVLDIHSFFPKRQPLEIELGAGDGSFIARYARMHPENNFLAVERLLGRARKVEKKGLRYGLENLRVIRIEAGYFVRYLLPEKSISKMHIYFPDPWPKPRHARNRLIQPQFIEALKKVLEPGSEVFLRTDSPGYHDQMVNVFSQFKEFVLIETPEDLKILKTDFEEEFLAQGVQTLYLAYKYCAS